MVYSQDERFESWQVVCNQSSHVELIWFFNTNVTKLLSLNTVCITHESFKIFKFTIDCRRLNGKLLTKTNRTLSLQKTPSLQLNNRL